jgi:hypothetical protein
MVAGRPEKPIDWEKVKDLCLAGCSGTEIAPHFDIHHETFYDRCKKDNGINFTDFARQYHEKGSGLIRAKQYAKALGHTKEGDNTLLIWLGKQRCGQTEKREEAQNYDIEGLAEFFETRKKLSGVPKSPESDVAPAQPLLDKE